MRALRYAFDEAVASLWRGRQSGALSTATIAVALFVLGAFLIVTANLERLGREWSTAAEMSVYLRDDVTPAEQARHRERQLAPGDVVAGRANTCRRPRRCSDSSRRSPTSARGAGRAWRQSVARVLRGQACEPGRRRGAASTAGLAGCGQTPGASPTCATTGNG